MDTGRRRHLVATNKITVYVSDLCGKLGKHISIAHSLKLAKEKQKTGLQSPVPCRDVPTKVVESDGVTI
jgi:hypothetical protein